MKGKPSAIPPTKHAKLPGKLVIVGFGSVGQGVLPLLLRHLRVKRSDILIITSDQRGAREAARFGVKFMANPLDQGNYRAVLEPLLGRGDFLLNVSVNVASVNLIELCQKRGALYLDTCIEPWAGGYVDRRLSPSQRSNYALRETALAIRDKYPQGPTAVLTHGANPGLVSHFVKRALLDIARDLACLAVERVQRRAGPARGVVGLHAAMLGARHPRARYESVIDRLQEPDAAPRQD